MSAHGLDWHDWHGCIRQTLNYCTSSPACMGSQTLNYCIFSCIHIVPAWVSWPHGLLNFKLVYLLMSTHSSYMGLMALNLLNRWLTLSAGITPTSQVVCSGWMACVQSSFWEQQSVLDMWEKWSVRCVMLGDRCHVWWQVSFHSALIGLHICEYCLISVIIAHLEGVKAWFVLLWFVTSSLGICMRQQST